MAIPTATNGTTVLLSVRTSTGPDVYTDLGTQTNVTFERTAEEIDASNKNDGADMLVLSGRRKQTFTADNLFVNGESAFEQFKTLIETGAFGRVRRVEVGSDIEQADFIVTSLSESFPDQDVGVVSISGTVSGAWGAIA